MHGVRAFANGDLMSNPPLFEIQRRGGPLIISIPHLGTWIPDELRYLYTSAALKLADTDWHLDRLYSSAEDLDATVIQATVSRYVIDLNRPPTGESLYPGMITTSLCPVETFHGEDVYQDGKAPHSAEIARRVEAYWRPYHAALGEELARLRAAHANVLLWEAHSIASFLPRLFPGKLPDFNFGTSDGQSCAESVIAGAVNAVRGTDRSWVLNGRFKGGFITRRYGAPEAGVHTIQLELCQSMYMDEYEPFDWRADLASTTAPLIRSSLQGALTALTALGHTSPERSVDILQSSSPSAANETHR